MPLVPGGGEVIEMDHVIKLVIVSFMQGSLITVVRKYTLFNNMHDTALSCL